MRLLLLSAAVALVSAAQATSTLHIRVTVDDRPVVRHALLISDVPVSASPRRVVTGRDGTVDVRLKPGQYTVESDNPVSLGGRLYQWTQAVTIVNANDLTLELTAKNAEVGTAAATETTPEKPDLQSVFEQWQASVVTVWTETSYGLGFLIDQKGLIVTNQRVVGQSETGEVEITPQLKVAARVVSSDLGKNVAVMWVDPSAVASVKPVQPRYGQPVKPGEPAFTVGATLHGRRFMTPATIEDVKAGAIDSDVTVDPGNAGGPVFTADGQVIGITTLGPRRMEGPPISGIISIDVAKSVIAEAVNKIATAKPPSAEHLPVEPSKPFPEAALKAAEKLAPTVMDYQVHGTDFDVTFITPVQLYAQQSRDRDNERHGSGTRMVPSAATPAGLLSLDTFDNWEEYAAGFPPVLMARVTPKMTEGFWAIVGRQAAQTQGVQLPPAAKHARAGLARLQLVCGETTVTPIHPFRIEHQLENDGVVSEGLYVYEPSAIGPQCGTVKVVLFSEKDPSKGDPHVVEPKTLDAIARDFASYK